MKLIDTSRQLDYKLVVPKVTKTTLGGKRNAITKQKFSLSVDIKKQTVSDIRTLLQNIIISETEQQQKIGNQPNILRTDGKQVNINQVKKRIQVWYGSFLAKATMSEIEHEVQRVLDILNKERFIAVPFGDGPWTRGSPAGRAEGEWRTRRPKLSIKDWEWSYLESVKKGSPVKVTGNQDMILAEGDILLFRPKTLELSFYTAFLLYWNKRDGFVPYKKWSDYPVTKYGLMGDLSRRLRRKPLLVPYKINTKWWHGQERNYTKVGMPGLTIKVAERSDKKFRKVQ